MIRILTIGLGKVTETAVIHYLSDLSGVSGMAPATRLKQCAVVIVAENHMLRSMVQRVTCEQLPPVPLWMRSTNGALSDISGYNLKPLSDRYIAQFLRSREMRQLDIGDAAVPRKRVIARPTGERTSFSRAVRRSLASKQGYAAIKTSVDDMVFCDFNAGTALVNPSIKQTDELTTTLAKKYGQLSLRPLDQSNFQAASRALTRFPLIPLLWQMALKVRDEDHRIGLLPPLAADATLQLGRWPDFRVLANQSEYFRLSSLLLKQGFTVADVARMLDIDATTATAFFNAAYLCGYADEVASRAAPVSPEPREERAKSGLMLASMWRSLRGRKGTGKSDA